MNPACGTPAAYAAHRKAGQQPCARCRDANSDYKRANMIGRGKQDHVQVPVWFLATLLRFASPEQLAMARVSIGPRTVHVVQQTAHRDRAVAS
jgi:hypothetical protein